MKRRRATTFMAMTTSATTPLCVNGWTSAPLYKNRQHHTFLSGQASWETSLAIIPPDEAWDRIQRSRHVAQDMAYAIWPPAIRLFHPFVTNLHDKAFDIANIIDKYQLEPFTIHMSEWSIIPHQEAMADLLHARDLIPESQAVVVGERSITTDEDEKFQLMVERVERLGRLRLAMRKHRERQKELEKEASGNVTAEPVRLPKDEKTKPQKPTKDPPEDTKPKRRYRRRSEFLSQKERRDKQRAMMDEFNGPCVVCLEPDPDSKARLSELRELFCMELSDADEYADFYTPSASSPFSLLPTLSTYGKAERRTEDYRPVIPIASFSTVTEAIEVASQLRTNWEPLSFNVTDFHLISSCGVNVEGDEEVEDEPYPSYSPKLPRAPSSYETQFGCDALVSLVGEELEMDDDLNNEVAQMVAEKGIPGGYEKSSGDPPYNSSVGEDLPAEEEDLAVRSDLEEWLIQEEDAYDEGTVVVMGRVQMFTGETREYVGMPASKCLGDQKGKMPGGFSVPSVPFSLNGVLEAYQKRSPKPKAKRG